MPKLCRKVQFVNDNNNSKLYWHASYFNSISIALHKLFFHEDLFWTEVNLQDLICLRFEIPKTSGNNESFLELNDF